MRKSSYISMPNGFDTTSYAIANPEKETVWDISVSCKQYIGTSDLVLKKARGEHVPFLKNCGGLEKRQVCERLQHNPDRKKKNRAAARVAQTYRGGFAIFNSVSPRWLQGPSGKGFPPSVLTRNSAPGRKKIRENK